MLVRDIIEDVGDTIGQCPSAVLYRRLNMAINMLANMGGGLWEGLIANMDIMVSPGSQIVTLPRDVLTPIAINLDETTSFPRDRWFRYRLSYSDGLDQDRDIAWTDAGISPTFQELSNNSSITVISSNSSDDGNTIRITGFGTDNNLIEELLTLNSTTPPVTVNTFSKIDKISKDKTTGQVELEQQTTGDTLAIYSGNETNPEYRQVRVNANNFISLSYRRKTMDVSDIDDFIPLKNQLAVLQAVRSVNFRFKNMLDEAQKAQQDAFTLLADEQNTRNIKNSPTGPVVENIANDPLKFPNNEKA